MYPVNYTVFMRKVNALFEGDENGDFVLAEDVNELQEAIERLEQYIGIGDSEGTISERLERLSGLSRMKLDTWFRESSSLVLTTAEGAILSSYEAVSTRGVRNGLGENLSQKETGLVVDVIVGSTPLAQVQTDIGAARSQGATKIWLKNFGWSDGVTRTKQEQVLASVREVGCQIVLSNDVNEIRSSVFDVVNNVEAIPLSVAEDTFIDMGSFTREGGSAATASQLSSRYAGYGLLRSESNVKLIFKTERQRYRYDHAIGLLFGLDGLWVEEASAAKVPSAPSFVGQWKTTSPVVVSKGNGLRRYIKGGSIEVYPTSETFLVDGFQTRSEDLVFSDNTIPGSSIQDNSIEKTKIASYDADKIIQHLNTDATLKIQWSAIEDSDGSLLPGNIPAENMQENVIKAINRQAGDFTETLDIVDDAIKTLSASKLTGDIASSNMKKNVIAAINTAPGSINVASGRIGALTGDTVNVTDVTAQTVNGQVLNMTEGFVGIFSSNTIESLVRIDAADIFAQYIKTTQLDADVLKVQDVLVDDLISNKITTETLDAVMANIGSAEINNLVAESIKAQIVKSELVVSLNSMVGTATIDGALIGDASIVSAKIVNLDASKINTGSINTGLVTLDSPDGHLKITGETVRIYDAADGQGQRRLRTLLGNTGEIVPGTYGLVVLGEDGTTRLYDNTGVYNAGIHDNAISNGKLQDDSVDGRVIVAESILAEHVAAGEINALHLAAGSIVAGSAIIAEGAIGNAQISELDGGKITADSIEGTSIKAGTITADLLSIGFGANQMKHGYDSFEVFETGSTPVEVFTPQTTAVVSESNARVGDKSLLVGGNATEHIVYLHKMAGNFFNGVTEGKSYYVSGYAYTTDTTGVDVYIGLVHATGTLWSPVKRIKQSDGLVRVVGEIVIPAGVNAVSVALRTIKANADVFFDCIMIEEKEAGVTEPSMWMSASLTEISGDMITTGTINATKGITFQAGAVVIDETGINLSKLGGRSVSLDSDGLTIRGGALTIEGGLDESDLNPALTSKWNTASDSIADVLDNGVITVYEKYGLSREWQRIDASFKSIWSQAVVYGVTGDSSLTEYQQAKEDLRTFLFVTNDQNNGMPVLAQTNSSNDSVVDGALYAVLTKAVYEKEVLAMDRIETAISSDLQATKDDISGLEQSASSVAGSLANILSDDKVTANERKNIRDAVVEMLGQAPSGTSPLPSTATVNTYTSGSYASSRLAATQAGVATNDSYYVAMETAYTTLRTYLNGVVASGYYLWDVTESSKNVTHDIVGETFRSQWQAYYNAQLGLQTRTAKRVSDAKAEAEVYASSYRNQLVLNGFGDIGSNRNFSAFTYTTTEKLTGTGSFSASGTGVKRTDDFIVVEARKTYILTMGIKASSSSNTHRIGIECYDANGTSLGVRHVLKTGAGSVTIPSATSWSRYEGRVGGEGAGAGSVTDKTFPLGTKKVKVWMELNIGGVANTVYLSDVTFEVERIEANKDYNGIVMSPENGLTITSSRNTTSLSATKGLEIIRNAGGEQLFRLDATTGDLLITGNVNMRGGTISWADVNSPSAADVGAATQGDLDDAVSRLNDFDTLTSKVGTTTVINGSMVQSGTIKGDFIDAKNLVVRDAGNVETLKVDSAGNVSINGVVTIKSGSNVYTKGEAYSKTETNTAVKNSTDTAFAADQGLAMKIGYSTYTTATANNIYFHGFNWDSTNNKYVAADVNGKMLTEDNITFTTLNKGRLNLSAGVPSGSIGFIVYDNGTYWYVVWSRTTGAYTKYNSGVTGHGTAYTFSTSSRIIGELEI